MSYGAKLRLICLLAVASWALVLFACYAVKEMVT